MMHGLELGGLGLWLKPLLTSQFTTQDALGPYVVGCSTIVLVRNSYLEPPVRSLFFSEQTTNGITTRRVLAVLKRRRGVISVSN
jgi:hypothetical protein